MKILEVINEAAEKKLSKSSREAAPHAKQFTGIDQYYQMYSINTVSPVAQPKRNKYGV